MASGMRMCRIAGCKEEITDGTGSRGGLPICHKCRGVQYSAKSKGLGWLERRQEQLQFWEARISYLSPHIEEAIEAASKKVRQVKRAVAKAEPRASK
jgi:hypothetical protein